MTYARWASVDVDVAAIGKNVRALKSLTAPGTLFMAVVKADAYGHGAAPVARVALAEGADRLGVATVDEALDLRRAGLDAPIHILSEPPPSAARLIVEHALVPTVTTGAFVRELGLVADRAGESVECHLEVDTGMNRVGVPHETAHGSAALVSATSGVRLGGVFTHFATAEVPGDWDFERQVSRFTAAVERIRDAGVDPGIVHAANSAAVMLHSRTHFDMVRCGIAIYGVHPAVSTRECVRLAPAMSVKARVSFVKRVGMGEGVSYGFTWRAAAPTTVATLPLGYADGVHRALSNSMDVLIRGVRCAQIGRVCMDQLMVELPRGVHVEVGDEAVLVGTQEGSVIELEEVAQRAGTIPYEMACAFGMRMPRSHIR